MCVCARDRFPPSSLEPPAIAIPFHARRHWMLMWCYRHPWVHKLNNKEKGITIWHWFIYTVRINVGQRYRKKFLYRAFRCAVLVSSLINFHFFLVCFPFICSLWPRISSNTNKTVYIPNWWFVVVAVVVTRAHAVWLFRSFGRTLKLINKHIFSLICMLLIRFLHVSNVRSMSRRIWR